ncbi:hypothetical protein TMEN_9043 [Trichophyton mentagrophytes]|uniref:Uncharacterized protein n=3 Tax=Trichophyton TaxID=5550 RepID=A0A9P5CVI6_9EURO|nr:hypothetical protein TEQG_03328 [Trichophyton equinum CBS 127.97]KAF3895029.1 hypothetical protein GY631_2839 [Trichophyton interdigitale]KDB25204.1 hypothetical protein H109_02932 [Trichophyton interdigitale MR816]GBF66323.1 hypothetical protein TMEN_9043 [Trichophyton mentagrophytes]KAF3896839.1 hypothetical protein GY632_2593 [Trichophyton interdigitale]
MPPNPSTFTALNVPSGYTLPESLEYFSLAARPDTDLWRKPPDRETSTAPILYTSLQRPFVLAEVTVTADWEMEWDQGGLVIFSGPPPGPRLIQPNNSNELVPTTVINLDNSNNSVEAGEQQQQPPQPPPYPDFNLGQGKWVKAGLEFSAGTVNASSVSATSDGADWCLSPLAPPNQPTSITSLRIKLERIGHSLWVWYQIPPSSFSTDQESSHSPGSAAQSWRKLREVTWFFWGVEDKSVHIGVYACRPANISISSTMWAARNGGQYFHDNSPSPNSLVVDFEDLEIF